MDQFGVLAHQFVACVVDGIGQFDRVALVGQRQLDGELVAPHRDGDVAHGAELLDQLDRVGLDQADHR